MTDDKGIRRRYSEHRETSGLQNISMEPKTSTRVNHRLENYYSHRNCPEILSLYALTNRDFEYREKRIYQSMVNDSYDLNTINYPLGIPPASPIIPNLSQQAYDKQPMFPKLIPRTTRINQFPSSTPKNSTSDTHTMKTSMPKITTSVKSISSSLKKPLQTKMPIVLTDKKKNVQLPQHLRSRE